MDLAVSPKENLLLGLIPENFWKFNIFPWAKSFLEGKKTLWFFFEMLDSPKEYQKLFEIP